MDISSKGFPDLSSKKFCFGYYKFDCEIVKYNKSPKKLYDDFLKIHLVYMFRQLYNNLEQ